MSIVPTIILFVKLVIIRSIQQPNIITIVVDDLGWADVPWNNPESPATYLGKYASEGIILDRHYAHPKCSPSRAALLTGRFAWTMGRQRGAIERYQPTGMKVEKTEVFITCNQDYQQNTKFSQNI